MHRKGVLIIDDDDNDRILMHRALHARGLKNIQESVNGEEAIALLTHAEKDPAAVSPWLVILDLHMPRKDGFEVLRWMRNRPRWQTIPVVVFSNSEAAEDIRRAYKLGCNAYTVKPTDPSEMMFLAGSIREFWMRFNRSGDLE